MNKREGMGYETKLLLIKSSEERIRQKGNVVLSDLKFEKEGNTCTTGRKK